MWFIGCLRVVKTILLYIAERKSHLRGNQKATFKGKECAIYEGLKCATISSRRSPISSGLECAKKATPS